MIAGTLTEIIKIWRPRTTINSYGEQVTDYEQVTEERANVKYASNVGRNEINQAIAYNEQFTFIVYHYVDVRDFDIIEYNGTKYNIVFIQEERMQNIKKIMCEKIYE